jgi:hypothetical protein
MNDDRRTKKMHTITLISTIRKKPSSTPTYIKNKHQTTIKKQQTTIKNNK